MMKIKKINITYLWLLIASVTLFSCEDLFESASIPEHFTPGEKFYTNADQINLAVVGCYNGLQSCVNNEFFVTEVRSDNAKTTIGATYESVQLIYRLDAFMPQSSNPYIEYYWRDSYANIQNINKTLAYTYVVDDVQDRRHFEGELRMLRAYHYFNLVRLFGPLPVYISATEVDELGEYFSKTRASVEDIYKLIEADLKFASENLRRTPFDEQSGRVTAWSARALLSRVFLTVGKYQEAKLYLSDILAKASRDGYGLESKYSTIFSNEESKELLFSVRYAANVGNIGSPFANYFAPIQSGNAVVNGDGKGYNYPTDELIFLFQERNDPRGEGISLEASFINEGGTEVTHLEGGAYCNKYISQPEIAFDAENDFPVIRYADVVLMMAEVLNELEGPASAAPYLNMIRERAKVNPFVDITTRSDFKDTLLLERRLEFAFENLRWFDLLRFNKAEDTMTKHFQDPTSDYDYLDPNDADGKAQVQTILPLSTSRLLLLLPEKEIKANPNLVQNVYN